MRVIAGRYRSRPLRSLCGMDVRPTTDRLRETLFNVLTAGNPATLEGSLWIDVYAGTGAVGIEALSRGAGKVIFVESSAAAVKIIGQNLNSLRLKSGFEVLPTSALQGLRRVEADSVCADIIFLDPPYRMEQAYRDMLRFLAGSALLKPSSIVIAEHHKKFDPGGKFGSLARYRTLQQGDAALSFYRRSSA